MRIYLDHNATTPLDPAARDAMLEALALTGNPSSVHAEGRAARDLVERARRQVAALLAGRAEDVVFTSGGTEANHLALLGGGRRRVLAAAIEHPSVLGGEHEPIPVDAAGRIDLAALERMLAAGGAAAVVAVALANHELGTVQDLPAIAALARAGGARVHCDAVQAAGRLAIDVGALGADTVALSGHKIHGPKGAGALWIRPGVDLAPLVGGGHQERERRPGTENVAGIAGLGAAAELAAARREADRAHLAELGGLLEAGLIALGARVHGAEAARVPGVVNAAFAGAPGELVVQALDLAGVAVSTGAACTSGTVKASPVLLALGVPEERAREAVRFSAGRGTSAAEVRAVLEMLPDIIARIRAYA